MQYVPVDFTKDDLLQSLKAAGYDPSVKTVFTLEGVTMYLDADSVKETLSFIVKHSGPGSCVMFDYMYKEVLDGKLESKVISRMNKLKFLSNEPVIFGIGMGEVESFIRAIGFDRAKDYPPRMLYEKYFKAAMPDRTLSENYAVATAYKD